MSNENKDRLELLTQGKLYLKAGLSILPVTGKQPTIRWSDLIDSPLSENKLEEILYKDKPEGLAIICGSYKPEELGVIDIDTKHALGVDLGEELLSCIPQDLRDRLAIVRTPSGGLHLYFRSSSVGGNTKLARRPTTTTERDRNKNERVKVLVETRGVGGYVVAPPSPGYSWIQGDYTTIPVLTEKERSTLFSICKSFDIAEEPDKAPSSPSNYSGEDRTIITPWKDYNERGDVIGLLERHGWSVVRDTPDRIYLRRPGDTEAPYSGNFHKASRRLYIFSTSTELPDNRPLSPSDIFLELECNGDTKELRKRLSIDGYGIEEKPASATKMDREEAPAKGEAEEFIEYLQPCTREEVRSYYLKQKENLPTGYYFEDGGNKVELAIPSGQLTIIAGRTSHRKTGLMLNLCKDVADRLEEIGKDSRILFLSYEESGIVIQSKLFNLATDKEFSRDISNKEYIEAYYKGKLKDPSSSFLEAEEAFYRKYIDSKRILIRYTEYRAEKLCRLLRWINKEEALSAVFIDYIQLLRPENAPKGATRQMQLFEICEDLRQVAIDTTLPIIFGGQFNREVDSRDSIDSSRIREAGDIEQTANIVLGIWDNNFNPDGDRVEYDKQTKEPKTPPRDKSLYIEVLKGRDMGTGWKATLEYNPPTGRIYKKEDNKQSKQDNTRKQWGRS